MKKITSSFGITALLILSFIFTACGSDNDNDETQTNPLEICEIFTFYEGDVTNSDNEKQASKIKVSFNNTSNTATISLIEGANFPSFAFNLTELTTDNNISKVIHEKFEISIFKSDKINITIKSLDAEGNATQTFAGTNYNQADMSVEKPISCSSAFNTVYRTYTGTINKGGVNYENEKIIVSSAIGKNAIIMRSENKSLLPSIEIPLSNISLIDGCYTSNSNGGTIYFCPQGEVVALGFNIISDGINYQFLGANF